MHILTYNPGVVVVGQHPLTERHQQPECLLFFGVEQQHRCNNIHSLQCVEGEDGNSSDVKGCKVSVSLCQNQNKECVYLTVSDVWVSECIGCEDPAEGSDAHLILEGRVLGERAVQVPLNLLCCQVVFAHRLLNQVLVVSRVGGHLVDRPC